MIGGLYLAINNAAAGHPIVRTHDVVYAYIKSADMIGYSRSVAAGYIAVCKLVGDDTAGVGYRAVVEVAAQDYALSLMVADISCHGVGLRSTDCRGHSELVHEFLRLAPDRILLHLSSST